MQDKDHGGEREQLKKRGLPGTGQAGKEPGSSEKNDDESRPGGRGARHEDQFEKHSLPGTNQAGKGPTKPDADAT